MDSMMNISLIDAATNCQRDGAIAIVTIRGSAQFTGKLDKPDSADPKSAHIKNLNGGWATILTDEIVAIETRRSGS